MCVHEQYVTTQFGFFFSKLNSLIWSAKCKNLLQWPLRIKMNSPIVKPRAGENVPLLDSLIFMSPIDVMHMEAPSWDIT